MRERQKISSFVNTFCTAAIFLITIGLHHSAHAAPAQPIVIPEHCVGGVCLFVAYDASLSEEAKLLVETLHLRLCKRGVQVGLKDAPPVEDAPANAPPQDIGTCADASPKKEANQSLWWIVHLRELSDEALLVAVDYLGAQSDEDLIREVPYGPDTQSTSWTIALMIEEVILPYLETNKGTDPIGAGLAIIEPPAVRGIYKPRTRSAAHYPEFRYLGAGVTWMYLDAATHFLVGPYASVQGLLGPRFLVSFGAGWFGTGKFDTPGTKITGKISHMPLDLLFGYLLVSKPPIDITVSSGVSIGFVFFEAKWDKTEDRILDPNPWARIQFDISLHIYGPLAAFVTIGAAFPIVRDTLRSDVLKSKGLDDMIYKQDWGMPLAGIGMQLWI